MCNTSFKMLILPSGENVPGKINSEYSRPLLYGQTEYRLIIFFVTEDGEALHSQ